MVLWRSIGKGASKAFAGARHKCTVQLQTKPAISNFWIAGFLGFIGDYGTQRYIQKRDKVDQTRLAAMSLFCASYSGAAQHYIFLSYDYLLPRFALATALRAGISKSLFDNFVHAPFLYIPTFYICLGLLQGHEPQSISVALEREWASSSLSCAAFWTPIEGFVFGVVPQHFRILVVNLGNLVWNMFLSVKSQASAGPPTDETSCDGIKEE
eukprot:gnl/TRDRNA2_/TRDRNA2_92669_c0_seq1.p1 gnl/TRDRNA2_/TRDRNA2_92669_c0~~gnl/TRDRNA2_/TRDRNA2_92669_c0_seq1.p1  ORF type:complete len:211 (-),score=27.47 gnl/TRDRNA2_/TRDRNA2_92669_c0_seq1:50-682(-)